MKRIRKRKGQFGYLSQQRKWTVLRTILYFGVSLSLFLSGYMTTHTTRNLLTLVAVLGCLPASKSAVNMVMFLRYHGCTAQAKEQIEAHIGSLAGLYDMVFTSYEKNFPISHLTVHGKTITAYTQSVKFDPVAFAAHLTGIFKEDGIDGLTMKVFTDLERYTDRLDQLNDLREENKRLQEYLTILMNVAL